MDMAAMGKTNSSDQLWINCRPFGNAATASLRRIHITHQHLCSAKKQKTEAILPVKTSVNRQIHHNHQNHQPQISQFDRSFPIFPSPNKGTELRDRSGTSQRHWCLRRCSTTWQSWKMMILCRDWRVKWCKMMDHCWNMMISWPTGQTWSCEIES